MGVFLGGLVGFVVPFFFFSCAGDNGFDADLGLCSAICCGPIYWVTVTIGAFIGGLIGAFRDGDG